MGTNILLIGSIVLSLLANPSSFGFEGEVKQIEGWSFSLASGDISIDNGYFARLYDTENPLSHYNYSNQWGELLTEDGFDEAKAFSEGLAYVKYGDIDGYIDTTGALVIQLPAGTVWQGKFHDGRALIRNADGSSYYIDKSGTPIIRCAANILSDRQGFSNGLAPGIDTQSGLCGYYNETGNWEIPPQYDLAASFEDGYAVVSKNGNYGVIDVSGSEIIPFDYEFIYRVSSEPALFALRDRAEGAGNKYIFGLADSYGTILVEPQSVWNFNGTFSDGYCPIFFQGSYLPGLLTESGEIISLPYLSTSSSFREGLLQVNDAGHWKYINTELEEEVLLPEKLSDQIMPTSFFNGQAVAYDDDRNAFLIDTSGNILLELGNFALFVDDNIFPEGVNWAQRFDDEGDSDSAAYLLFDPRLEDYASPWAEGELAQAKAAGLVTESNDSYFTFRITRRRFAELMANLVEKATGQTVTPAPEGTFSDTDDLWVRKAAALGIVNGFGDGRFSPNGYINREQVAAALCRAVRYIEGETGETILPASANLTGYADADQVSPWAADSMAALTAAGLLQGTSGATLSPKDTTTVEQGILLALRAYQAFAEK